MKISFTLHQVLEELDLINAPLNSGSETTILVIYVLVAVFPTCLIIVVFIVFCRRRRRGEKSSGMACMGVDL